MVEACHCLRVRPAPSSASAGVAVARDGVRIGRGGWGPFGDQASCAIMNDLWKCERGARGSEHAHRAWRAGTIAEPFRESGVTGSQVQILSARRKKMAGGLGETPGHRLVCFLSACWLSESSPGSLGPVWGRTVHSVLGRMPPCPGRALPRGSRKSAGKSANVAVVRRYGHRTSCWRGISLWHTGGDLNGSCVGPGGRAAWRVSRGLQVSSAMWSVIKVRSVRGEVPVMDSTSDVSHAASPSAISPKAWALEVATASGTPA